MHLSVCMHRSCTVEQTSRCPGRPSTKMRLHTSNKFAASRSNVPSFKASSRYTQHRSRLITCAKSGDDPHLQLATARLPSNVNVEEFKRGLYQWASSLTSSGRNMPFSLPIKTTHTKEGFECILHGRRRPSGQDVCSKLGLTDAQPLNILHEQLGRTVVTAIPGNHWTCNGIQMSLLRIFDGEAKSVGDIVVTVEDEPQKGNVLFARFFEGNASFAERTTNIPSDPMKRVQEASSGLVDVPIIMQTMQDAIKRSVIRAR